MSSIKSVAVIGLGPAGAISLDALAQEKAFDTIRAFERRDRAGGCWIEDPEDNIQQLPDLKKIAERSPDETLPIPAHIPATLPHNTQYRFSDTTVYPTLETNIDAEAMAFSQEPFPQTRTSANIEKHGEDSPFRHWKVVERYIQDLVNRRGGTCIQESSKQ
ncbi:putative Thiol-specific monooxygenase [Glarea lozoyensis 74030]|uniref:Putative Thiol-specific monooxygenase n=1 Tax=Glarea lozoyensis (strain ATCC 74030 / MF5533) TaxID=1104152 RepID=H0EJR8_GLAL7|nr:putative Thiol-specific monooxygenase [Glarea lozoyensis 74030]